MNYFPALSVEALRNSKITAALGVYIASAVPQSSVNAAISRKPTAVSIGL